MEDTELLRNQHQLSEITLSDAQNKLTQERSNNETLKKENREMKHEIERLNVESKAKDDNRHSIIESREEQRVNFEAVIAEKDEEIMKLISEVFIL